MFNFFSRRKPERKIKTQLHVFYKWRLKKGMSLVDYDEYLDIFINYTEKEDILDVDAVEIMAFLEYFNEHHRGTQYSLHRAELAIRQFKRFYAARGAMIKDLSDINKILDMEGVHYIVDVKRNKEIVKLWLRDQEKPLKEREWSLRKLGERFNISHVRVDQIIKREIARKYRLKAGY